MADNREPRNEYDVLNRFLDHFTAHGFPKCGNAFDNGSVFRRLFWLFIALVFTGVGTWQCLLQFDYYYTFPTVTSIEVVQNTVLTFPSVTVCPLQSIRQGTMTGEKLSGANSFLIPMENDGAPKNMNQMNMLLELNNQLSETNYTTGRGLYASDLVNILQNKTFKVTEGGLEILNLNSRVIYTEQVFPENEFIWNHENYKELQFFWSDKELNESWNGKFFDFERFRNQAKTRMPMPNDHFLSLLTRSNSDFLASLQTRNKEEPLTNMSYMLELKKEAFTTNLPWLKPGGPAYDMVHTLVRLGYLYLIQPFMFNAFEFVTSCTFKKRSCRYSLYHTIDPVLKSCIHYNNEFIHRDNEGFISEMVTSEFRKSPRNISGVGREDGLSLNLKKLNFSSLGFLNPIEGYAVAISDSATMPRLDQYVIVPNTGITDLGLQRTEINRLTPEDQGNCAYENHFEIVFPNRKVVGVYDQSICNQLLVFFRILEECDCYTSSNIMGGIIGIRNLTENSASCTFAMHPCMEYGTEQAHLASKASCPPACHEVKYDIFATSVSTDAKGVKNAQAIQNLQLTKDSCHFDPVLHVMQQTCTPVESASLNIFYRTKSVQVLKESLIMTPLALVGNVGGLAGLWVGVSLMSFVELLEVLFDILTFRLRSQKTKTIPSEESVAWAERKKAIEEKRLMNLEERLKAMEQKMLEYESQVPRLVDSLQNTPGGKLIEKSS